MLAVPNLQFHFLSPVRMDPLIAIPIQRFEICLSFFLLPYHIFHSRRRKIPSYSCCLFYCSVPVTVSTEFEVLSRNIQRGTIHTDNFQVHDPASLRLSADLTLVWPSVRKTSARNLKAPNFRIVRMDYFEPSILDESGIPNRKYG